MFISKVPLVEFYRYLLPTARAAGYKMALIALAREADAPTFYDDVKRYWSSLHDATGPDILFVFAGANAADELNERGLRHKRRPVAFHSDQLAFQGLREKKWKMYWEDRLNMHPHSFGVLDLKRPRWLQTAGRYHAYLDQNDSLSRDHTLEIYSLSRFLDLRESELPCLVFTLLKPGIDEGFTHISLPFECLRTSTIYLYLKRLAESFECFFKSADKFRGEIEAKRRKIATAARELNSSKAARSSIRHFAKSLPNEAAVAVAKILDLTDSSGDILKTRSECYREFKTVKAVHPHNLGIIPELQRLIDLTFSHSKRPERAQEVTALMDEIGWLESEQEAHWSLMEERLKEFEVEELATSSGQDADSEKWDFFIAYSAPDKSLAERVFSELSKVGRTFLDIRCLRPGERWTERIRAAQDAAKCSVVIIAEGTPHGWFTESEYLHAIQLARTGQHQLIPVLYGKQAQLPYGLEQVHAARVDDWSDLKRLPEFVKHIV